MGWSHGGGDAIINPEPDQAAAKMLVCRFWIGDEYIRVVIRRFEWFWIEDRFTSFGSTQLHLIYSILKLI